MWSVPMAANRRYARSPRRRHLALALLAVLPALLRAVGVNTLVPLARSWAKSSLQPGRQPSTQSLVHRHAADVDVTVQEPEAAAAASAEPDVQGNVTLSEGGAVANKTASVGWAPSLTAFQGIAALGVLDTAYLTLVKLGQAPLACPTSGMGCTQVLSSPWASVGPVPLAAFGLLAYLAVLALSFVGNWKENSLLWWLCLLMATVSFCLEGVILILIKAPCLYCALSAACAAGLLVSVEVAQARQKAVTPRRFVVGLTGMLLLGSIAVSALPDSRRARMTGFYDLTQKYKPEHPPLLSTSSAADKALAKHLTAIGAHCYTAWWCPHCQEQREQFGAEAALLAPFVQCAQLDRRTTPECKAVNIDGYPTWIIEGQKYSGIRELSELANITNFTQYPLDAYTPRDDKLLEYIWGKDDEDDDE